MNFSPENSCKECAAIAADESILASDGDKCFPMKIPFIRGHFREKIALK
jgi:hypothetical protein